VEIGEGPVRAPRESTFDPDTRAFYLQTEKNLLKFVFAEGRLSFSRNIPLPKTDDSGTRQIEHFVRVPEPAPGVPPFLLATTSKDSATTGELGRWPGGESLANLERIGHRPLTPRRLFAHPSAEEFYLQSGPSEFKRIRLLPGGLEVSELPTAGAYRIVLDPNGRFFLSGNTSGRPKRQEIATLQPTSEWPAPALLGPEHNVRLYAQDYALSDDGRYLAGNRSGALELFDLQENGKRLLDLDEGYFSMPNLPGLVAISPDNRSVAFATAPKQAGTSLAEYTVVCVDLETLTERWRKIAYGTIAHLHFLDDATLAFFSNRNAALQTVDVATGDQLNMTFASAHPAIRPGSQSVSHHAMAYSRDGSHIAFAVDGAVSILHRETLSARFHLPVLSSRVLSLAFFTNPRYLLVGTEDQQVLLYDLEAEQPLVTMAFFGDDNEWVLTSPDLRFQSSTGAADRLYVVKERDTLPLGALYEKFHTPRLLHRLLDGEALSPMLPPESLQAAPEVALEWVDENGRVLESPPATDTVRVRVTATSEASEVAEIRLYHNGKIVSARQRGLVVEDDVIEPESPSLHTLSRTYVLGRLDGPNTFRAIALNRQRTESAPVSIELSGETAAPSRGFTLHLFVVGIDTYANPKYNLNYATADAEAFLERIQKGAGSVFSQIRNTYLHDAGASRSKILESFEAIAASAQPRDVLVFYYAGHGVMSSEIEPEFYLVPSEVTQLYGNDALLRERAISAGELRELAARIPAQKQLFILDACQSAGALQTVAMRGAAEEKAIAQLARSTGTHWLTATGSDQFAAEFETLGHGVFTYSILQALQGAADTGDGQVTVRELDAFLQQRVPELTKEHRGLPQYPASYGFGQDFPLSLVPQKP
jgi:WD40 repeat protein